MSCYPDAIHVLPLVSPGSNIHIAETLTLIDTQQTTHRKRN